MKSLPGGPERTRQGPPWTGLSLQERFHIIEKNRNLGGIDKNRNWQLTGLQPIACGFSRFFEDGPGVEVSTLTLQIQLELWRQLAERFQLGSVWITFDPQLQSLVNLGTERFIGLVLGFWKPDLFCTLVFAEETPFLAVLMHINAGYRILGEVEGLGHGHP